MPRMRKAAAALWCLVALSGCSHEIGLQLQDKALYLRDHKTGIECFLPPEGPQVKALISWLESNRISWKATPVTYVPRLVVSGEGFSLNFMDTAVIANYEAGQYAHPIEPQTYAFLRCGI
jgi:hypothetical protein